MTRRWTFPQGELLLELALAVESHTMTGRGLYRSASDDEDLSAFTGHRIPDPPPSPDLSAPPLRYGNLRTADSYKDPNLTFEVRVPSGSNGGVYLRGLYEVEIMDRYGEPRDAHTMGAIYGRIPPSVSAERPAGEWQRRDITECDRHVTVVLNGEGIIGNQPLVGITGGALSADPLLPGPFVLQGDHGPVAFRDMVLTPILRGAHLASLTGASR